MKQTTAYFRTRTRGETVTRPSEMEAYQSPWISAADLNNRPARLTIAEWAIVEVRTDAGKVKKIAVSFKDRRKRLLCNKTQAGALEAAFGDCEAWIGKTVILQPGRTQGGQNTVEVLVPPMPATEAAA